MAYSKAGIANLAIQRLGAKSSIVSLTDGSPNAAKVNAIWEYILYEVIEAIKPAFATVRVALAQSSTAPANTDVYKCAYPFPADYLTISEGDAEDPAIWPSEVTPYAIETLSDGTLCLMTNYDTTEADYSIYLTYIRKVDNPGRFIASFVNALAFRMAAELALSITETQGKFEAMMTLYDRARRKAIAENARQLYIEHEQSNTDWELAGR